jgi:hypothetical protein
MGQLANFVEIPPDLFKKIVAGKDPELERYPQHSIDKAWDRLHAVLQSKGPPLSLAITGDRAHPDGGHSLDEFIQGDHDYYIALMSPRLVQEVAKALTNVTAAKFKQWENELGVEPGYSVEAFFPELKDTYLQAAAAKNALMIMIA